MVITFPLLEMEKEPPKRLRRLSDFPRAQGSWGLGREHGSLGPKPVLLGTNLTRLSELLFQVHESSQADSGVCRGRRGSGLQRILWGIWTGEGTPQGREQGRGWLKDAEQAPKMGISLEWESFSRLLERPTQCSPDAVTWLLEPWIPRAVNPWPQPTSFAALRSKRQLPWWSSG